MAAYLGCTLRMRMLFRGWPIMVNDTHMRRRRRSVTHCLRWGNLTCATFIHLGPALLVNNVILLLLLLILCQHSYPSPNAHLQQQSTIKLSPPVSAILTWIDPSPPVRDMDLPSASAQEMIGLHWHSGRASFLSQWWHSCLYMAVIRYLCIYCWSTLCVIFWHRSVRPSRGHISKTNQDRPVVTVEHYKEVGTTETAAALISCRDVLCGEILVSKLKGTFNY